MTVAGSTALSVETSTNARDAALAGDARHQPRGERVVAHGLDRVGLHEPDVLVGGGVEDDGRAVLGEDLAHPLALLAVGQHGGERRGMDVAVVLELALDLEEVVLGVVEQDEPRAAPTRAIWRQSSEPIEPPAPVTSTTSAGEVARRRGRAPCARARGRGRPRPAPRAPGGRRCPPACSSSKTVGSVRTGMPRSRHARTTRARSVPGAEGIAIMTSSGSASSRMRGRSSVAPEHASRRRSRMPRLSGSSSTKPTGVGRAPGCAGSRAGRAGRRRRRRRSARGARRGARGSRRSGRS